MDKMATCKGKQLVEQRTGLAWLASFNLINSNGVNPANGHHQIGQNPPSQNLNYDAETEALDSIRVREITAKAVSGSLLLMLKWFKRSRPCW